MESQEYSIRFRHTLGDLGPFQFDPSTNIQSVKDQLFSGWPSGEAQGGGWQTAAAAAAPQHSGGVCLVPNLSAS